MTDNTLSLINMYPNLNAGYTQGAVRPQSTETEDPEIGNYEASGINGSDVSIWSNNPFGNEGITATQNREQLYGAGNEDIVARMDRLDEKTISPECSSDTLARFLDYKA